jgi:tryptophanyl-tRNA synthetase
MNLKNPAYKRILTGDRPTGPLHLGHYCGSLKNRVALQDKYETFILVADIQALTTNFDHPEILKDNIFKVVLDYLSVGISPEKSTIIIQSMIPEIAELTIIFSMFISINALKHNPTIKTEAKERGYKELNYGFLGYPISQTADITVFKADIVPVGIDQLPHIELARKIARRFNELYGKTLVEPEALLSEFPKLLGLDGNLKMSKSYGNAIYLSDEYETIKSKIKTALTDKSRIHPTDLGHPEICTIFSYHKTFSNSELIKNTEYECRNGKIGCVQCKNNLFGTIKTIIEPMNEKRQYYKDHKSEVWDIIFTGTKKAKKIAEETLIEVKSNMKLNYL